MSSSASVALRAARDDLVTRRDARGGAFGQALSDLVDQVWNGPDRRARL